MNKCYFRPNKSNDLCAQTVTFQNNSGLYTVTLHGTGGNDWYRTQPSQTGPIKKLRGFIGLIKPHTFSILTENKSCEWICVYAVFVRWLDI